MNYSNVIITQKNIKKIKIIKMIMIIIIIMIIIYNINIKNNKQICYNKH